MKMFSDCSGKCEDCSIFYVGGCLAGHGDDDFSLLTEEKAKRIINGKHYKNERDLQELLRRYPNIN